MMVMKHGSSQRIVLGENDRFFAGRVSKLTYLFYYVMLSGRLLAQPYLTYMVMGYGFKIGNYYLIS